MTAITQHAQWFPLLRLTEGTSTILSDKTVYNSGSCLWFWVLVLGFRFVVSGLISERQLIHTPTWKNLKIYSICLLIYTSVSPKNSNISNKFKKLLNTISRLKFTYDLCCAPHIFVMLFRNAPAHYKKMQYLVVHNTRKYWHFFVMHQHTMKNWCITKKWVHYKNTWRITKKTGTRNLQTGPRNHKQESLLLPSSFLTSGTLPLIWFFSCLSMIASSTKLHCSIKQYGFYLLIIRLQIISHLNDFVFWLTLPYYWFAKLGQ